MTRHGIAGWVISCALLAGAFPSGSSADVTVFAAASLKEVMDEHARAFSVRTGEKVTVVYAGSNALAKQIDAGAGAHLFVSADIDWMNYLDERRLIAPGSRVVVAHNTLVLVAPAFSNASIDIRPGFGLAALIGDGRMAMANPDSVPAGKYGRIALQRLGVWSSVEKRVARTENVRAALALVARGEAALGIAYGTDVRADPRVRIVGTFPADSHPTITYLAALIATGRVPAATALLEWLRSDGARSIWERHGFSVPQ
jgi:molybdate transport system substrate-binding protein